MGAKGKASPGSGNFRKAPATGEVMPRDPAAPHVPPTIARHPKKMKAALMLGQGAGLYQGFKQVAAECGISEDQLYHWRCTPDFQQAVHSIMRQELKDVMPGVYHELVQLLKSKDPKLKLRAAELAFKLTGELVERTESTVSVRQDAKSILAGLRKEIEGLEVEANKSDRVPDRVGAEA